jgi:hypothetical protein
MTIKKLPQIKLNEPERKWMELLWNKISNKEKYSYRTIRASLISDLPKNFHPRQISRLLVDAKGERITLLGIYTIDSRNNLIEKANRVVEEIRNTLIKNPTFQRFISSEIGQSLKIPEEEVGLILNLLSEFGWLIRGASISDQYFGYSSIEIADDDDVFDNYLNFNSVEDLIWQHFEKEKEVKGKSKTLEERGKGQSQDNSNSGGVFIKPIFSSKVSKTDEKLCFVLMPFREEWSDRVYKLLLRETIESLGLQCLRADNLTGQIIMEDIWIKINQAAFIIADVTNWNPNVMYELGIVHTIGKPAILITQDLKKIPFDFKHLRHFEYKDNAESFINFKNQLKEVLVDLYKTTYQNILLNT